jgi:aminoglycoside phosphotransferase (APT) family kinase protein
VIRAAAREEPGADPVVDLDVLGRWMDDQGLAPGEIGQVERLGGGTQNIMLRFRRGQTSYVLRRPPLHPRANSNSALLREMRVLKALQPTAVPVPRIAAECTDPAVLGDVVFYLMEEVDGFSPEIELPLGYAADRSMRIRFGLEAARAAALLGEVEPQSVGLSDLGHPEGFLDRQVGRWLHELETYTALAGYPGPELPHLELIGDWLTRNQPNQSRPGIVHGDFHLANLLFRRDEPVVAAIVDWEMATLGDPLLDLGWLLATWPDANSAGVFADTPIVRSGGLPGPQELVAAYKDEGTRDTSAIGWYEVLACFKLGILLEGTYARSCAGLAPTETGRRLHAHALDLFARARTRIE